MRRLMSGYSLAAALILGGMMDACQPTKPCHCVQSGGCRCPMPPPPKNASAPKEQSGQAQPTNGPQSARHTHEAQAEYAALGREERFAHRDRRGHHSEVWRTRRHGVGTEPQGAEEHESRVARPGKHFHRAYKAPSFRSGGALSYDYHSASGSYRLGAYSPTRDRFALRERERESFEEDRFHVYRHDGEREQDERRFEPARMSINSPEALDPWRGYGVECPDRDSRE
jgi:hypothetical protein